MISRATPLSLTYHLANQDLIPPQTILMMTIPILTLAFRALMTGFREVTLRGVTIMTTKGVTNKEATIAPVMAAAVLIIIRPLQAAVIYPLISVTPTTLTTLLWSCLLTPLNRAYPDEIPTFQLALRYPLVKPTGMPFSYHPALATPPFSPIQALPPSMPPRILSGLLL
jgi:hypothetical protein